MHYAMINGNSRQSSIRCQNDCYRGAIRKIRDLFYPTAGPSYHRDVKKFVQRKIVTIFVVTKYFLRLFEN